MLDRERWRDNWLFFAEFPRASRGLAAAWWALVVSRGVLPALFAVATGVLVTALQRGTGLPLALAAVGALFITVQVIAPLQGAVGASLGARLMARLNDRLLAAAAEPPGLGHLEDPDLADDLAAARDYELELSGPPMPLALELIAGGLTDFCAGLAQAAILAVCSWWAGPLVAAGWLSTRLLLRTTTLWDRETGDALAAQRRADYSYRLAVDPPAAKEVRLFGLSDWVVERFAGARRRLVDARWNAARMPRHRVAAACVLVVAANVVVLLSVARGAAAGALSLGAAVTFVQAAVGASGLALGGAGWTLPYAAQAVANVRRLEPRLRERGALAAGDGDRDGARETSPEGMPRRQIRFRHVTFAYSATSPPVLDRLDLTIPAGSSLAVVGLNGAGKTTVVKLLCRLYDPTGGRIEVDGTDLRELDVGAWRRRLSAIFQDYVRYDLSLRENVAPLGGSDADIGAALGQAGIGHVAGLGTVLAAGYPGGTDLSGGQWQRVALARVLHGVRCGAGVVILDEPTAQLDVRGEAEVFRRLLDATRGRTTILISHRFSTVRRADRICVLERGRVAEQGTHDELMAAGGRYKTMFDLQASRFGEEEPDEPVRT
ncbi:MAG TPA: ATP-binding cassette domain-containing protein [Trebonia sp.]|jgi:ATP-binding cassette subfamily B protein|nr:ATP-binding cassette domain-containing protein [Trebonia sp.]